MSGGRGWNYFQPVRITYALAINTAFGDSTALECEVLYCYLLKAESDEKTCLNKDSLLDSANKMSRLRSVLAPSLTLMSILVKLTTEVGKVKSRS